jgi:hypothetical protein
VNNESGYKRPPFLGESIDLLRQLKGQRIIGLVRLPPRPAKEYCELFGPLTLRPDEVFARCDGPAFLTVESGLCVGFGGISKAFSVCAWKEDLPLTHEKASKKRRYDLGGTFIDCRDAQFSNAFWANLVGRRIDQLAILTVSDDFDPDTFLGRNERGLLFSTEGQEWFISSDISGNGAGFLLMPRDDIANELAGHYTLTYL